MLRRCTCTPVSTRANDRRRPQPAALLAGEGSGPIWLALTEIRLAHTRAMPSGVRHDGPSRRTSARRPGRDERRELEALRDCCGTCLKRSTQTSASAPGNCEDAPLFTNPTLTVRPRNICQTSVRRSFRPPAMSPTLRNRWRGQEPSPIHLSRPSAARVLGVSRSRNATPQAKAVRRHSRTQHWRRPTTVTLGV
jgi:hypothetical protein